MKMEEKNINEELIISNMKAIPIIRNTKSKIFIIKILKRQNRNASIFSIGIFLYAFSITWLFIQLIILKKKNKIGYGF